MPPGELNRRKAVQKISMLIKVWFNGREACRTDAKPLAADFKVNFGRLFQIRIAQWPESVSVQMYESGLVNTLFTDVYLKIPDGSVTSDNTQMVPVDFSNDKVLSYTHEAVGSSAPFTIRKDSQTVALKTRGQLICSIAWGLNDEGEVLAPRMLKVHRFDALNTGNKPGQGNVFGIPVSENPEEILRWTQHERVDPNDPSNAGVALVTKSSAGGTVYNIWLYVYK